MTSSSASAVLPSGSQFTIRIPLYMFPFSYKSINTLITDFDKSSSIVNLVLDQSQDAPSFLSCSRIIPPYFSFHSQAYSRNFSLVSDSFSIPFFLSIATTFASVAIDA